MTTMTMFVERVESPAGTLLVVTDAQGRATAIDWEDHWTRLRGLLCRHYGRNAAELKEREGRSSAAVALDAYFGGRVGALDTLEVATRGTDFQKAVWASLRSIPVGTTVSYARLATSIGRPRAVRAVARANATNPVSVLVPCHRVVGADGTLTGYAGGVERKRWLLEHEARWTTATPSSMGV